MATVIGVSFVLLLLLGFPIAFVLFGAGVLSLGLSPASFLLGAVPEQIFSALNSFTFLTIPLFVFAGAIMAEGGVAERLMRVATLTIGRGRGGLGAATVVSTLLFSGISGSSTADTVAIGKVTLPALKAQGYPLPFSAALVAAAGGTAALIPPSIDLIIIGIVANISIAALFAAGIIPALINAAGLIGYIFYVSRRKGYGVAGAIQVSLRELTTAVLKAVPAFIMMAIVLGGILGGAFTPTEASAVAVVYGLFVGIFVYRQLTWESIPRVFRETIEISGVVLLVIAMGAVLGYAMTIGEIPQHLADALGSGTHGRVMFIFLVQVAFFAIGMFMDTIPALLILMPLLTPIAISHGINPVHFGILVEANVALGLVTPPIGVCLFAACAVSKLPLERLIRPLLPMIAILTVTLLVISYVEGFTLFLPSLLGLLD